LRRYDFRHELAATRGATTDDLVSAALHHAFGHDIVIDSATEQDDRAGVDYWVTFPSGQRLGVDLKLRRDHGDAGDVALEIWSAEPSSDLPGRPGWSRDPAKITDYVLWVWQDVHRYYLAPYPLLRRAFETHYLSWADRFRTARQSSGSWTSTCVFVPIRELEIAMYHFRRHGIPTYQETAA